VPENSLRGLGFQNAPDAPPSSQVLRGIGRSNCPMVAAYGGQVTVNYNRNIHAAGENAAVARASDTREFAPGNQR